jgi:hypothetical protein
MSVKIRIPAKLVGKFTIYAGDVMTNAKGVDEFQPKVASTLRTGWRTENSEGVSFGRLANAFSVPTHSFNNKPRVPKNPGLELANAFGVTWVIHKRREGSEHKRR